MKKISVLILMCCFTAPVYSQSVLGQLGSDEIKELTTTVNVNENPIIIINSPIANLRVESKNRNIIKRIEEAEGRWAIIVPSGTHKLIIDAKGYERLELENFVFAKSRTYVLRIFEVRAPRNVVELAGKGSMSIRTIPDGATITLDGIPGEWKSPANIKNIIAASYTVTVSEQNYDSLTFTANIIQDSTIILSPIHLVPQFGFLRIITDNNAMLEINNETLVCSSDSVIELPRGKYPLLLKKYRYKTFSKDITILSGDTTVLQQALVPNFAYFDFSKLTADTKIKLDSKNVEPTIIEITPGEHRVSIENARVGTASKNVSAEPGVSRIIRETDIQDPGDLLVTSDVLAQLFIDGREAPLSVLQENIPAGLHTIKLVHRDLGEEVRTIHMTPSIKNNVFISMLPSRSTAAWLTVFPGVSQMYRGMTFKGLLYLTSFLVSAAGSYYFNDQFSQQNRTYIVYIKAYNATTYSVRAAELDRLVKLQYSKLTTTQNQRQIAFGATGAIFVWNIIDSFLFGPRYGYRRYKDSALNFQIESNEQHVTMGFNVPF